VAGEPASAVDEASGRPSVRDVVEHVSDAIGVHCRIEIVEDERLTATIVGGELGLADRQARPDDRRDPVPRERDRLARPRRRRKAWSSTRRLPRAARGGRSSAGDRSAERAVAPGRRSSSSR
jgi:hypothetical protein